MKLTPAIILIASLLIGGSMDYQEAQDQADIYCEMVREGSWPNYKHVDCEEDNGNDYMRQLSEWIAI